MSNYKVNNNKMNDIIKGCLNNDSKSQKLLFDTYANKLMAVSFRYMGDMDEAHEVLQEGFIKIFDKLHTYNASSNIESWMKRIIVNVAIDKLRKRKKDRKTISSGDDNIFKTQDHDLMYDFELADNQQELANILIEAINKLSPAYKLVFNMFVVEDYSHAEIAKELGVSEGTSKSNYFKAKAKLRSLLKGKLKFIY